MDAPAAQSTVHVARGQPRHRRGSASSPPAPASSRYSRPCTRSSRPICPCARCRSPAISRASDPARALQDLQTAADLNPLNADPGRIGGTIALQTGQYATARERFQQSISREPGGWYAWLGSGLAASALGDRAAARHDLEMAEAIDSKDAVIQVALDRVDTAHPLTPADALQMVAMSSVQAFVRTGGRRRQRFLPASGRFRPAPAGVSARLGEFPRTLVWSAPVTPCRCQEVPVRFTSSWGPATNEGIHETHLSFGRASWGFRAFGSGNGPRKLVVNLPGVPPSDVRVGE